MWIGSDICLYPDPDFLMSSWPLSVEVVEVNMALRRGEGVAALVLNAICNSARDLEPLSDSSDRDRSRALDRTGALKSGA